MRSLELFVQHNFLVKSRYFQLTKMFPQPIHQNGLIQDQTPSVLHLCLCTQDRLPLTQAHPLHEEHERRKLCKHQFLLERVSHHMNKDEVPSQQEMLYLSFPTNLVGRHNVLTKTGMLKNKKKKHEAVCKFYV